MQRLVEIVSGVPRWTIAAGAGGAALVVLAVVGFAGGGDGSLATGAPTSTDLSAPPTTRGTTALTAAQHAPLPPSTSTSTSTTTTTAPPTTVDIDDEYDSGTVDSGGVVARPIPNKQPAAAPPPTVAPPPWAESTRSTPGGLATEVGCADNVNAAGLDAFFADRVGPVLGWDYQHVVPLGGGRHLWLFQDTFIDHTGRATSFDQTSFAHNSGMLQHGRCFTGALENATMAVGPHHGPTEIQPRKVKL